MLTDQQFEACLAEITVPQLAGWELFLESHGFRVYRKSLPNTPLYEYKALGHYPDVPARLLAEVFTDLEYRKTWDKNMVGFKRLDHGVIHYTTRFPWPLSPREYFYELTMHEPKENHFCVSSQTVGKTRAADGTLVNLSPANNKSAVVLGSPVLLSSSVFSSSTSALSLTSSAMAAAEHQSSPAAAGGSSFLAPPSTQQQQQQKTSAGGLLAVPGSQPSAERLFTLPPSNKSVRVEEYRQDVVMIPSEDGLGCHVWFGYFDDPKGHIPSSIVNWATKSGIPAFLRGIQDACLRRAKSNATLTVPAVGSSIRRPQTPDSGIEA